MKYMRLAFIFSLLSVPAGTLGASLPNPDRQLSEPPAYGQFVGVKATVYEKKGIPGQGVDKYNIHPGVVVGGPNEEGHYQVAMISKNLPHNPPQHPIEDLHPGATTYGNVDLSPAKTIPVPNMRLWLSKTTGQPEPHMTQENLEKLKAAMVPHKGWTKPEPVVQVPAPGQPPNHPPNQKPQGKPSSGYRPNPTGPRFNKQNQGQHVQGGSSEHPQGAQQNAGGSRQPYRPPANIASSSSKQPYHPLPAKPAFHHLPPKPAGAGGAPHPLPARPAGGAHRPYPPPKRRSPSGGESPSKRMRFT